VLAEGVDITWAIRSPEVDANVSQVSAYPGVRAALTAQQRRIGLRGRVVMVGRDIGTVVMPDAELKVYLDASAEARARRRYLELQARGAPANFNDILNNVFERDRIDSTRPTAPLKPASDAILVNSEHMDADQVFDAVKELVYSHDPTLS
jgi:cytidylate kinase